MNISTATEGVNVLVLQIITVIFLMICSGGFSYWFAVRRMKKIHKESTKESKHAHLMQKIVMDILPLHIFAKNASDDFKYIFSNAAMQKFFHKEEAEIQGMTDFTLFPEEFAKELRQEDEINMMDLEHGLDKVFKVDGENGEVNYFKLIRHPFVKEDGTLLLLGAALDVTELETARTAAEENAEWLKLTLNAIGDGVLATDTEGRILMLNPVAERMMEVTQSEVIGKDHEEVFRIVNYMDDTPVPSPLTQALRTGNVIELANHTDLISISGQRFHISDSAAPIRNHSGKIIGAILVFRDVTEEYLQRNRLRDALTSLEFASELTSSAAFQLNIQTREITGSKCLPELLPIRDGKVLPDKEFVYPLDLEIFEQRSRRILAGESNNETWDYRSDYFGELRYYRVRAMLDRSQPGKTYLLGVVQDISEITFSAGKLKGTLEFWEVVINSIPIMFFAKDPDNDFRYVLCNQAYADFHGKTKEEIIGKTDAELFPRQVDIDQFRKKDLQIMQTQAEEEFEATFADSHGKLFHCQTVKKPFLRADGHRLLLGVTKDVSELRHLIDYERFSGGLLTYVMGEQNFDRVLEYVAQRLITRIHGGHVILACCNSEGKLRMAGQWHAPDVQPVRDIEQHYRIWDEHIHLMESNQILKIDNPAENSITQSLYLDPAFRNISLMAAPIFVGQKLWGTLFVSYIKEKWVTSDMDEDLMQSCSNVIALAAAREKQAKELRRYEEEMQMIFDNVDIPISLHDASGKLIHVNVAAARMTGLSKKELLASPEKEIYYIQDAIPQNTPLKQVMSGKQHASAVLYRPDGRQYILHADAVINKQGTLVNIVKSAVDVTELNNLIENQNVINFCLETLLRESNMEKAISLALRAVCSHIGASRTYIFQFNTEHRTMSSFIEYAAPGRKLVFSDIKNQPYSAVPDWETQFSKQEMILAEDLSSKIESDGVEAAWGEIIHRNSMKSGYAHRIMLGNKFWGFIGLIYEEKPHRMNLHEIDFIHSVAHFIEAMLDRWLVQTQLMEAVEKAQTAERAKSFFIASVSHEIRTPLNAVIGFAELLRNGNLSEEEQKEYVENITYSGNSLLDLINDVLDLSKLEADQMEIMPKPTNVEHLGNEVMKVFTFRAAGRKLELKTEIPQIPELNLDHQRIRQILFNLIGNAVKFTEQGSITLKAEFMPENERSGTLVFTVTDTGIGIAEADQKNLMKPFVQLSKGREANGTGLGLSISKRLAEKMGGKLWLISEPGKGSTFGVTLHGITYRERTNVQPEITAAQDTPLVTENLAILIVDDVEMNLKVLKAMCSKLGIAKIVTVSSGKAAMEALNLTSFDLILTDMWMPEMNGCDLLARIRQEPRFARLPVIAVTADVEAEENFEEHIFSGIILKPVTMEKLRQAISSITRTS